MTELNRSWDRIKPIVAEAMELLPDDRRGFLERECQGDTDLFDKVLMFVSVASQDDGFLSRKVDGWLGLPVQSSSSLVGHRIGRYTLIRVLGQGGSGVVYLAAQENPERMVAVKIVRSPLPLIELSERFRLEAAALGRIQHPNVAQIYEAGTHRTESGIELPYIAMEFVEGAPVTEYAAQNHLGLHDRLMMMACVAEAVHAAHQRAVIHRDLKPSNVLVNERGEPKVLDFGIARIDEAGAFTRVTATGSLLGTPAYMSPEMYLFNGEAADIRSDVWSLGAMLYELLTGQPVRGDAWRLPPTAQWTLSEWRAVPIKRMIPTIGRDLECVVMTALAHEREARYASAQALADDLRRVLADETIAARRPGQLESATRFVRRHKVPSIVSVAFLSLLALSSVLMALLAHDAAEERDRAQAVVSLLKGMISQADPNSGSRHVTMLDALSSIESRIAGDLRGQPRIEADVRSALGGMFFALAEYGRARTHFERAIEIRGAVGDHARRIDDQIQLANTLRWLYLPDEARLLIERTRNESVRRLGNAHATTLQATAVLAGCAHDEHMLAESEAAYRDVVTRSARSLGLTHEQTLHARSGLASVLIDSGRYDEAEAELRAVIRLRDRLTNNPSRETLTLRANLALTLAEQGRLDEAIEEQRRVAHECAEHLGDTHDSTVTARTNLAESLRRRGMVDEALSINQLVMESCAAALGWTHENTLDAVEGISMNLIRTERAGEALVLLERVLSELEDAAASESDAGYRMRACLAAALAAHGQSDDAIRMYTRVIEWFTGRYGNDHMVVLATTNNLGLALIKSGQAEQAVTLYEQVLETISGRYDSMQPVLRRNLGHALLVAGDPRRARLELTAARDASLARGELENAERCTALLAQVDMPLP